MRRTTLNEPNHPHPGPFPEGEGSRANLSSIAVLLTLTLLAYFPAFRLGFVNFDDPGWVTANPAVQRGLCPASIRYAFRTIDMGSYNPLTWLSLELDVSLFGPRAGPMHAENILWHAANTALVFLIFLRMGLRAKVAMLAAAVFGVHPLHVESVAWITERKDVLCAFFFLLAVYSYLRRWRGVVVWFGLSLAAKPMAVTLPALLLLLDAWPLRRWQTQPLWRLSLEKWPLWALAAASSVGTILAQRSAGEMADTAHVPLAPRFANAAVAYAEYLEHFFWPLHLAVYYPYLHWSIAEVIASFALLVVITVLASRRTPWFVGWLWFLGTLVPTIGLVQVGGQSMADRYLYLPMVGLLLIVGEAIGDRFRWALRAGGAAVVLILALLSVRQIGYWRDTQTLFTHALAVTEASALPHVQLGLDDLDRGQPTPAAVEYQQAIALAPTYFVPEFDLANLLLTRGNPAAALSHYARAAALRPDVANIERNWAIALLQVGDSLEAARHFERAIADDPTDPTLRNELRLTQQRLQRSATTRQ